MTLNEFRNLKQQMTVREMLDNEVAIDMVSEYTDDNNRPLSEEHAQKSFLIYPGGLAIERDHQVDESHPLKYHLRIANFEMIGGADRLPEMEVELYEWGIGEERIP